MISGLTIVVLRTPSRLSNICSCPDGVQFPSPFTTGTNVNLFIRVATRDDEIEKANITHAIIESQLPLVENHRPGLLTGRVSSLWDLFINQSLTHQGA